MPAGKGRNVATDAATAARSQRAGDAIQRACSSGNGQGVADAVAEFERITQTAGEAAHPTAMLNLINALLAQAEVSDSDDALDRALDLLDEHEELFRDEVLRLAYLAKRGSAPLST
jgi:hypothetical protein